MSHNCTSVIFYHSITDEGEHNFNFSGFAAHLLTCTGFPMLAEAHYTDKGSGSKRSRAEPAAVAGGASADALISSPADHLRRLQIGDDRSYRKKVLMALLVDCQPLKSVQRLGTRWLARELRLPVLSESTMRKLLADEYKFMVLEPTRLALAVAMKPERIMCNGVAFDLEQLLQAGADGWSANRRTFESMVVQYGS